MKFIDEAVIEVSSGDGAPGAISFMRQRGRPKMGPDGGNGGRGGNVYFQASNDMQSLLDFKFKAKFAAPNGSRGEGYNKDGPGGDDITVKVPVGTSLFDADSGELLADLVEDKVPVMLLKGGMGGLGNMNFATPSRQAPEFAQPGLPGQQRKIRVELKLLADVGLVGFPNAGKSTLISRWSSARPKIADYPFTTLIPNLGVVRGKSRDFVLADIPGLIEGASDGRGLGVRFLKHCERTKVLVILLDLDPHTERSLLQELKILENELSRFSQDLAEKPRLIALNKLDAFSDTLELKKYQELLDHLPSKPLIVSAVSGAGLDELKAQIEARLNAVAQPIALHNTVSSALSWGDETLFDHPAKGSLHQ